MTSITYDDIKKVEKDLIGKLEKSETRLEKRMDERFNLVDKRFDLIEKQVASIVEQMVSLRSLLKWLIALAVALIPGITAWLTWASHLTAH